MLGGMASVVGTEVEDERVVLPFNDPKLLP